MANSLFNPSVLYEALKEQGLLPQWAQQRPTDGSYGMFKPTRNKLIAPHLNGGRGNASNVNTLAHEMTHVVQTNLLESTAETIQDKRLKGQPITEQEAQFLRAAQQILRAQFGTYKVQDKAQEEADRVSYERRMKALYKHRSGDPDHDLYRTTPTEALAWGVGGMTAGAAGGQGERRNPHLNPSMATEFMMLLDMYQRLPKPLRDASASRQREYIEKADQLYGQEGKDTYKYVPMTGDPFKPTIK